MKRLWTGKTPKQELFCMAVTKMIVNPNWSSEDAVTTIVDRAKPGTIGDAMRKFYEGMSYKATLRFLREIDRAAKR